MRGPRNLRVLVFLFPLSFVNHRKSMDFFGRIQTSDGHWAGPLHLLLARSRSLSSHFCYAGDYGGPMFLLPGLAIVSHATGLPSDKIYFIYWKQSLNWLSTLNIWRISTFSRTNRRNHTVSVSLLPYLSFVRTHFSLCLSIQFVDISSICRIAMGGAFSFEYFNVWV